MKKIVLAVAAVLSIGFLSSCSAGDTPTFDTNKTAEVFKVKLSTGKTIECIIIKKDTGKNAYGGPSCDWANKK